MNPPHPISPVEPNAVPMCSHCGAVQEGSPNHTVWRRNGAHWVHLCQGKDGKVAPHSAPCYTALEAGAYRERRALRARVEEEAARWPEDSPARHALRLILGVIDHR